jgi:hypothetical protein
LPQPRVLQRRQFEHLLLAQEPVTFLVHLGLVGYSTV